MKISKTLVALALCGVLFTGCKQSENAPAADDVTAKTASVAEKPETASFEIDGMTCAVGCAKTIEKKLAGMDGVQKAVVDFDKKTATVEFDAAKLSSEKLVEAVEATADGKTYKVSNVKTTGDHAMLIEEEKDKKKKKTKKGNKKECSVDAKSANGKPACCAAKKSCNM